MSGDRRKHPSSGVRFAASPTTRRRWITARYVRSSAKNETFVQHHRQPHLRLIQPPLRDGQAPLIVRIPQLGTRLDPLARRWVPVGLPGHQKHSRRAEVLPIRHHSCRPVARLRSDSLRRPGTRSATIRQAICGGSVVGPCERPAASSPRVPNPCTRSIASSPSNRSGRPGPSITPCFWRKSTVPVATRSS
jgi:hypothetical protein